MGVRGALSARSLPKEVAFLWEPVKKGSVSRQRGQHGKGGDSSSPERPHRKLVFSFVAPSHAENCGGKWVLGLEAGFPQACSDVLRARDQGELPGRSDSEFGGGGVGQNPSALF